MRPLVLEHRSPPRDDTPVVTWCRIELLGPSPTGEHYGKGVARVALPLNLQCDRLRIVAHLLGTGDHALGRLSGGGVGPDGGSGREYELVHSSPLHFDGRSMVAVQLELERVAVHAHPGPRLDTGVQAPEDPWSADPRELLDRLRGTALDADGQERVRQLLSTDRADQMQLAAQIAVVTDWLNAVPLLQRKLLHPSAAVRREMVTALGQLGEPSALKRLQMLRHDPDVLVQKAVREAIVAITGNGK